jgi:acetyl-CoA acetyltransferase
VARHPLRGATAIAGLGLTPQGKVYGRSAVGFAVDAVELALGDAGLARPDIDGLLVNPGLSWNDMGMGSFQLQQALGLRDLRLSATMNLGGATACAMIQHAAQAIAAGLCTTVACVFSDAPLKPPAPRAERPASGSAGAYAFVRGWEAAYGYFGVNAMYALVARRHMHRYGTTQDQLGAVAVAQRRWANRNPAAQLREQPLTLDDYRRSRWIVEPFHLLDCCLVSNGGCAVIVTTAERARSLRRPPVYVLGMAQGHLGGDPSDTLASGAVLTREPAFRMAGIALGDVDVAELYDCYTFTVLVTLEDYGFCAKGEGGPFAAEHHTGPGGKLAVNTGGGQLSSFYMWGMTPVSEAVIQLRGDGGARQAARHEVALVSGNGGVLSTHSTLILGRQTS